ncbi:hypothetical protein ODGCJCGO_00062 [Enterococcus phage EFKL]|nr:hypothetical protein ODGCJCGO_00062 [Enterococcus phage EFKL]
MNIASIDRGIYSTVEVGVGSSLMTIETGNNLITFNRSETEQLIQALQQALEELPEEPKYVVLLPQQSDIKYWEYFYLHHSGKILYSDYAPNIYEGGAMTLDEIKAVGKHYEPFAIPAKEFKENHLGEF